jgi:ribosomal-protein-alanine N-acetyltransferase
VLRESGAVASTAGLHHIDRERGSAQVAYEIEREHSGKGLMSEALRRVIDHAFGDLGLRRLEAHVDPDNERSIRLAEKLGFSRSAEIPGTVVYVLTSSGG